MEYKKTTITIFIIVIISFVLSSCTYIEDKPNQPKAKNGVIDLRGWDFKKYGPVKLDGEWEFYWEQLLFCEDFQTGRELKNKKILSVPGNWDFLKNDNLFSNEYGYGTYRLRVLLDKDAFIENLMAIKINSIASAHKLFIDGKEYKSHGVIGKNYKDSNPYVKPYYLDFDFQNNNIEILIHVSNFNHRKSGLLESIILGYHSQIHEINIENIAIDLFLLGSILVMGIYNLNIFIFRREEKSSLFFAIVCFLIALRITVTGERYITYLIHNINWGIIKRIEYLTMYLGLIFYVMFIKTLNLSKSKHIFSRLVIYIVLMLSLFVVFTKPGVFTHSLYAFQITFIVYALYSLILVSRHCMCSRDGTNMLLIGFVFTFITAIHDVLYSNGIINTRDLLPFGFFVLILTHSLLLVRRFAKAITEANDLAKENEKMYLKIQEINRTLESKVNERTEELRRKNLELEKAAITDGLTGLYNHSYIYKILEKEIRDTKKNNKKLSLIMIDLDNFKAINDTYGHQTGDLVLKKVAITLKESFRKENIIGRYGGEEFIIILPNTNIDDAYNMAERIRKRVHQLRFGDLNIKTTISSGVIELKDENTTQLIHSADELLYKAKNNGKNCVEKPCENSIIKKQQ